ncbi:MAG: hypothetical protein ACTHPS_02895 [Streptosporangiaceae bacterium]
MTAREGQDWHDPTRAMQARRDLDDVLRRALRAAVDPVEPADDGLTRIMHRLSTPSAMRQARLLVTDCVDLARLITIWLEPAFTAATRLRRRHYAGYPREFPHQATRAPGRPAGPWLRPAVAVAGAATIMVMAVVVLGPLRQIVTRTSLNTGPGASAPAPAGAHSVGSGHGQSRTANLTQAGPTRPRTTPAQAEPTSHRPSCAATSCPTSAGATPSPTVTPSGSPEASPSQSPTPTPTPSKTNHGHHKPHPSKTKGS